MPETFARLLLMLGCVLISLAANLRQRRRLNYL